MVGLIKNTVLDDITSIITNKEVDQRTPQEVLYRTTGGTIPPLSIPAIYFVADEGDTLEDYTNTELLSLIWDLNEDFNYERFGINSLPIGLRDYFNHPNAEFEKEAVGLAKDMVLKYSEVFLPILKRERLKFYHNQMNQDGINSIAYNTNYAGRLGLALAHSIEYDFKTAWFSDFEKIYKLDFNPALVVVSIKTNNQKNIFGSTQNDLDIQNDIVTYSKNNYSLLLLHFPIRPVEDLGMSFGKNNLSVNEINYAMVDVKKRNPQLEKILKYWEADAGSLIDEKRGVTLENNKLVFYDSIRQWLKHQPRIISAYESVMSDASQRLTKDMLWKRDNYPKHFWDQLNNEDSLWRNLANHLLDTNGT